MAGVWSVKFGRKQLHLNCSGDIINVELYVIVHYRRLQIMKVGKGVECIRHSPGAASVRRNRFKLSTR